MSEPQSPQPEPAPKNLDKIAVPGILVRRPRLARVIATGALAGLIFGIVISIVLPGQTALHRAAVGTLVSVGFALLGGLPLSLPLGWLETPQIAAGAITPAVILGVLYLGVVSTALAMYLWNKSLSLLDAGLVSLLFFAQPVVGAGLGATLLNEQLGLGFWAGALLIGAGLLVAARVEAVKSGRT